jgi:hypothetical protein
MRLQQVAKELHIELVVLHDQDGFGHPVPPVSRLRQPDAAAPSNASDGEFKLAPDSL